jgi:large subunit ribosomal protein L9
MQVVLRKDIKGVGQKNEIKKVKPGFFINYLFPKGLAKSLTPNMAGKLKKVEATKKAGKQELMAKADDYIKILSTTPLEFTAKAETSKEGDVHTLYGSIGEKEVAQKINEDLHLPVSADQIEMAHIKTTGTHEVIINLSKDHMAKVKVEIKAE